jgi:hypothetical protein
MLVTIIKDYKKMKVGNSPQVDDAYGEILIKKGVAKKVEPKAEKK